MLDDEDSEELKDGEEGDIKEKVLEGKKEASLNNNVEYRRWLQRAKGQGAFFQLLEKFCDMGAVDENDEDDGFESADDDDADGMDDEETPALDLDALNPWSIVQPALADIVKASVAIPHFMNVPRAAQDSMDAINENAFRCLTAMLWSKPKELAAQKIDGAPVMQLILASVHNLLEQSSLRLSETLLMESSMECLHRLVTLDQSAVMTTFFGCTQASTSQLLQVQVS